MSDLKSCLGDGPMVRLMARVARSISVAATGAASTSTSKTSADVVSLCVETSLTEASGTGAAWARSGCGQRLFNRLMRRAIAVADPVGGREADGQQVGGRALAQAVTADQVAGGQEAAVGPRAVALVDDAEDDAE